MADRTSSSITIDAAPFSIMAVIADFEAYPDWAGQVKSAEVTQVGEDGKPSVVRFVLDAGVVSDTYSLGYDWGDDEIVSWELVEPGNMLTGLSGSYRLTPADEGTEVVYELAVKTRMPMIGLIKRKAEKVIIDTALKGLKKRVEGSR